jgi:tetratricopeptide (TPR) repeat protein
MFALGIVRRLEAGLRGALETPPLAMRETVDRIQRDIESAGVATNPERWSRVIHHFLLIDLWSTVLFGSSQWLALDAVERAAEAPPDDDQAKWLRRMAETWTWARAHAPPISQTGGSKATADLVRGALQHGRGFLLSALTPLVLQRLALRPDGDAWLDVAALVAEDEASEAVHMETALAIIAEVVQVEGVTPRAQHVRGALLLRLGRTEEAEVCLRVASEDPDCRKLARLLLGRHYVRTHRYGEAVEVLRPIDDAANPDANILRVLFASYTALDDRDSASIVSLRARALGLSGFEFDRRRRR